MLRVVADTNIYISSLNFGGVADKVLALGRMKEILIFVSPSILDEIREVLTLKFKLSTKRAQKAIRHIKKFTQLVHPKETVHLIKEDEPDNRILECAIEAKADLVITGDKHIQKLGNFRGIIILSPREFLESKFWAS